MQEELIERHKKILEQNKVKNINLSISAIFCESDLEQLEKAILNCDLALLGKKLYSFLPCPGEGWSVSIDPEDSLELRGRGFVEVEFMYGNNHPDSDFSHIPIRIYKYLLKERYSLLTRNNFYSNGQIKRTGNYLNGERTGEWIEYYENGITKSQGQYLKNNKCQIWEYFYETAQIKERKDYDEKIYFISQSYWFQNGQIKSDWIFDKENNHYTLRSYYDDGNLNSESTKQDENTYVDGEHKSYFKDGKTKNVIVTKDNRIIQYRYYNEDGTVQSITDK